MNKSHHDLYMIRPNLYPHFFIAFALLVYSTTNISLTPLSNYDLIGVTANGCGGGKIYFVKDRVRFLI
jgi:hypothetical protein